MKKQKVEVEKYTLPHGDIATILGLTSSQRITNISASHSANKSWELEVIVETTQVTELPLTHRK